MGKSHSQCLKKIYFNHILTFPAGCWLQCMLNFMLFGYFSFCCVPITHHFDIRPTSICFILITRPKNYSKKYWTVRIRDKNLQSFNHLQTPDQTLPLIVGIKIFTITQLQKMVVKFINTLTYDDQMFVFSKTKHGSLKCFW